MFIIIVFLCSVSIVFLVYFQYLPSDWLEMLCDDASSESRKLSPERPG